MAHPNRRATRQRTDTTHPEPTRPVARRGGDRRAWPTAPNTTRISPAKPAGITRQKASSSPTPVTVWTATTTTTDHDKPWPESVVERVVTSFSEPGAHVVLLPWPNHVDGATCLLPVVADEQREDLPEGVATTDLAAAARTINRLGRSTTVELLQPPPETSAPTSRTFPLTRIAGTEPLPHSATTESAPSTAPLASTSANHLHGSADLVITSLCPNRSGDVELVQDADSVTLFAARLLRVGGVLAVLTHCDWSSGELTDPTGLVVTAGQAADLLYLQHVIVVRARANDGRLEVLDGQRSACGQQDDEESRTRHRALVRGLPVPHRRVHVDLLVFAQPHDHRLLADSPVEGEERR
ncbi:MULTISPECIES: hypothetical protein [Actinosynnema]|uniref:hypothetical protein n=1 Tax=Actinosynnema TaxID=40566 RepID=UPI0020A54EE3|nr:hypothetical protein [Actinosynnema pretiosum]MCP2094708.1 hypothetical protein [Actinosynnema pretiosum]